MAMALDHDSLGQAEAAFRSLSTGQRREFLRWATAFQDRRKNRRSEVPKVEQDLSVAMARMDFGEAQG